ncbi:hypothetical protein CCR97_18975 [Rhodoplanes elegans]|uniref:Uncharacterized protein n=1 Tax=Rhodoplanes elegans TaxID=29408 RepID=A0A327KRV8_9BRAD|nr:hypothetical protein [Rhodoplanes elegans]MBK5960268.1 hypothetical protein [Rhodoplanes elegans]RAI40716.1 hypothetical protein CH338_05360 [Rhodoplanes elegans]
MQRDARDKMLRPGEGGDDRVRVCLRRAWQGYAAGSVVPVSKAEAKTMVASGIADTVGAGSTGYETK